MNFEMQVCDYDLNNTLMSSFACYLFKRTNDGVWKGIVEPLKGSRLWQESDLVHVDCAQPTADYVTKYVTGLWSRVHESDSEVIRTLTDKVVTGIRPPFLFRNRWHVLFAALLSVHARMELSRAWFASIARYSPYQLREMDPLDLRNLTKKETGISAGYRMRYIVETLNELFEHFPTGDPLEYLSAMPLAKLRHELLRIRNIGPKVADCLLLNAFGDIGSPPVDVHVRRVSEYLGVLPKGMGLPEPNYCREFVCTPTDSAKHKIPLCPKSERTIQYLRDGLDSAGSCTRAALTNKFEQSGLVQANLFLFGFRHIRGARGRIICELENCPLKSYCIRDLNSETTEKRRWHPSRRIRVEMPEPEIPRLPIFGLYPEAENGVSDSTKEIMEEMWRKGFRPLKYRLLKALATWLACRRMGLPILMNEVAACYSVTTPALYRVYADANRTTDIIAKPLMTTMLIDRAVKVCGIDACVKKGAERMLTNLRIDGCSPSSLAAATLLLTSDELGYKLRQRTICEALHITEVTLRNTVKRVRLERQSRGSRKP